MPTNEKDALDIVNEGLDLLNLSLPIQKELAENYGNDLASRTADINRLAAIGIQSTASTKKQFLDVVFLMSRSTDFAAKRLFFESEKARAGLVLIEQGGPFLSDELDFSDEKVRKAVAQLIEATSGLNDSIEYLIKNIQGAQSGIKFMAEQSQTVPFLGPQLPDSVAKLNGVLDELTTLYNLHWMAFKDIIDGLKVSLGQDTFEKPDSVTEEDFTEEEWEAMEDAEDLADAKAVYATLDRSQLIPAGSVRASRQGTTC